MNDKVQLKTPGGDIMTLDFSHALELLRLKESKGRNDLIVVGNHEFKDNELIIKPSKGDSAKSDKPSKSTKGRKVRKQAKDSDTGV